jgi:hypothetical protein
MWLVDTLIVLAPFAWLGSWWFGVKGLRKNRGVGAAE